MVKRIILGLGMFLSSAAFATPNACVDFMKCGTYEGPGMDYDQNNQPVQDSDFVESITLSSTGDLSLNIKQSMWPTGKPDEVFYTLDLNVTFQANGTYVARRNDGRVYASGICQTSQVCTLSMIPFAWKSGENTGVTGNVNILRFENGKIYRSMMASVNKGDIRFQRSEMTKK